MVPKPIPAKVAPGQNNMPFYWEIKRRARLLGFIVLGFGGLVAAWHFAPGAGGLRAYAASLGFAGVALFCFGMAAVALAGLRREEKGRAEQK
jgi:hypothetical protein